MHMICSLAAHAFAEIGAGVAFGPNTTRAMELIDPGIHRGFLNCMTNNGWASKKHSWFSFRQGQDAHSAPGGTHLLDLWCETGQASVHRARFLDELVQLVPDDVTHFGKKLDAIREEEDHVVLCFVDGTTATHSAVIGCDGIKSKTREILLGADHPAAHAVFSGKYAYRGLIPMEDAADLLGDELARNAQMYLGRGAHILTFPIEHGQTLNVVAFSTQDDGVWTDSRWVKPMDHEAMAADFEGWAPATRQILSLLQKPDVWALFHHAPAPTYARSRICLLGDAAHASTPHNGAGAGQAVEDALILSRVLALVSDARDLATAFRVFDRIRRPRTQEHVQRSWAAGQLYELQDPEAGEDWDKVAERLRSKMAWYWEHDLEADVREARLQFEQERTRS
nr:6-methylsalicylic acid decarboxylase ata [Quercus suber]